MNRKKAFKNGLGAIKKQRVGYLSRKSTTLGGSDAPPYNGWHMLPLNKIVQGDCIELLNRADSEWADLVFADPPFNIGYLYHGYDDERKHGDYLKFSEDWMRAVYRALKPNGSFYLAIGDEYAADLCVIARRTLGFNLRNWIIWHYTFGQQTKLKFAKSHTHILYFTKSTEGFTFNADAVRVASARQTRYSDVRANPKGKLPDDVWLLRPQEAPEEYFAGGSDTWFVSRVCGTFKEREGWHGCQMPLGILNRVIKASSNPGDVVLDPFNGSGTTVVSAAMLGRQFLGIDQSPEYVAHAQRRLDDFLRQAQFQEPEFLAANPATLNSADRSSRVLTETDAFGRPRVARTGPRKRRAV
jgi:site-specific DNA-methyltransferase (adenine-specific)